jgi:hypothetical protein
MTTTQWKGSASTSTVAASTDWKPWADKISGSWQKATRSIIETGQDLIDAQANLTRDSFEAMLKQGLPMDYTTATRLMAIARHPVLSKVAHVQLLPPHWGTLYELTKVDRDVLEAKIKDGTITPQLQRAEVKSKVLCLPPPAQTTAEPDPPVGVQNAVRMILDAEKTAPPLAPETEKPDPVEAEQPEPQAERPVAPATDTVPTAPTDTADDEMESDEEDLELEPTAEETLTNAIESVELLLDKLFDEEIIYRLAEVDLDKRDAFLSRLRAGLNRRVDAIERAPVLDKADAIAALPESVKAYFRMHGRVSNCDVRWYMNRFPALNDNKLEDSERRAIADKLIRDMLQRGELMRAREG